MGEIPITIERKSRKPKRYLENRIPITESKQRIAIKEQTTHRSLLVNIMVKMDSARVKLVKKLLTTQKSPPKGQWP